MKTVLLTTVFTAAAAAVPAFVAHSQGQDPERQDPRNQGDVSEAMAEMMRKAAKYTRPGPEHEALERFLGTWDAEMTMIMGGRKTPGEKATVTFDWLVDGRWLQSRFEGTLMGQPFESYLWLGYDRFKMSYVMTMVSNMDTAMNRSEGDMDPGGEALLLYGTLDEYLTGEHDKMVKYVWRFRSDDEIVLEVHDLPIGEKNTKVVETVYKRRK